METHPRPRRVRFLGFATTLVVALGAGAFAVAVSGDADAATVGAGSYTEALPAGAKLPTGCGNLSTNPRQYLTPNAPPGAVPTNDWWSSLLFKKGADCAFSQPLFAGPAAYRPVDTVIESVLGSTRHRWSVVASRSPRVRFWPGCF